MIKELERQFIGNGEVKGFKFAIIHSNEHGFIYKVDAGGQIYHEVFKRRLNPICIDFEKRIYSEDDFKVKYPKSNDFGVWAWTYKELDSAILKFSQISEQ